MSRLIFAPAAQADIDSIYDYTAERWGPDQAERYVMQIRDLCLELALEARTGRDAHAVRSGYLKHLCGAHVVFYKRPEPTRLEIVRILHQAMDMDAHLAD